MTLPEMAGVGYLQREVFPSDIAGDPQQEAPGVGGGEADANALRDGGLEGAGQSVLHHGVRQHLDADLVCADGTCRERYQKFKEQIATIQLY